MLTSASQGDANNRPPSPVFERMEEYKIVTEDLGRIHERYDRQAAIMWSLLTLVITGAALVLTNQALPKDKLHEISALVFLIGASLTAFQLIGYTAMNHKRKVYVEYLEDLELEYDIYLQHTGYVDRFKSAKVIGIPHSAASSVQFVEFFTRRPQERQDLLMQGFEPVHVLAG